jgi:predicted nuclease of predicted toxin-antitoxin system
MRFLIDDQLPVGLARWIEAQGTIAQHVSDVGLTGQVDRQIWRYAATAAAIIVTKDSDFSILRRLEPHGPAVVWLRIGNTRKAPLFAWMDVHWPMIITALQRGELLVEVQ